MLQKEPSIFLHFTVYIKLYQILLVLDGVCLFNPYEEGFLPLGWPLVLAIGKRESLECHRIS